MGTTAGYVLNYDIRINSLVGNYSYEDSLPITYLKSFYPSRLKDFQLDNIRTDVDYLLISTATNGFELGLWNMQTLNCDIIFKVNTNIGRNSRPCTFEIPSLNLENTSVNDNQMLAKCNNNKHSCYYPYLDKLKGKFITKKSNL